MPQRPNVVALQRCIHPPICVRVQLTLETAVSEHADDLLMQQRRTERGAATRRSDRQHRHTGAHVIQIAWTIAAGGSWERDRIAQQRTPLSPDGR